MPQSNKKHMDTHRQLKYLANVGKEHRTLTATKGATIVSKSLHHESWCITHLPQIYFPRRALLPSLALKVWMETVCSTIVHYEHYSKGYWVSLVTLQENNCSS